MVICATLLAYLATFIDTRAIWDIILGIAVAFSILAVKIFS